MEGEEETADVVGRGGGELEIEPRHGNELLQPPDRTLRSSSSSLWMSKAVSWDGTYSWWKCCEDCCIENWEYYINLVETTVAGFERIGSNLWRNSTVDKMLSDSTACYRKMVAERTVKRWDITVVFRNHHSHPSPPPPPWSISSHPHWGKTLHQEDDSLKAEKMDSLFLQQSIFKLRFLYCFLDSM